MAYTKDQLTALQKEASNYGGFTDQKFIDYVNQKGGAGSYDTLKTTIESMQGQPTPQVQDPINTQTGTPMSANIQPTQQPTQLNAPQTIVETPKVETPAKVTTTSKTEQFDINKPSYQDTINEQVKQGNTETLKTKLNEGLQAGTLDKVQYNKMMNSVAQSETQQAKSLDNPDSIFNFLNTGVTISEDLKQSSNYTKAKNRFDSYQMLSGMNSSQLGSLLSNGTLLPGTTAYNDLVKNPEMKIKLDKINQLNLVKGKTTDINKVIETKSNEIANNTEVEIDGQKMTLKSALEDGFIDQNEFNAMTNTPQMTAKYQEVEDMRNEYDEQLATYKNIKTDIENRLKGTGATKTEIARAVAQAQEDLLPGLQATESRLNNAIGTLTQMKTDASQMFATNLGLYKEAESRTYEEQQAQKQLEQKFAYEYGDINSIDPNIQRVAIENAVAGMYENYPIVGMESQATKVQKVIDRIAQGMTGAEAIASVEQEIRNSPAYKDLMASQKASMTPETTQDWSKLSDTELYNQKTGEIKSITPKQAGVIELQEGDVGGQCGTYARQYTGITTGLDAVVGTTAKDRVKSFTDNEPKEGGLVLFTGGNYDKQYGHIAVVTSVNGDGTINITESNLNDDGKVTNRTVGVDEVTGFYNNTPLAGGFNSQLKPIYEKYNAGKMTQSELDKYGNDSTFLAQAEAYGKEKGLPGYQLIQDRIALAESLKNIPRAQRVAASTKAGSFLSGDLANVDASIKKLVEGAALQQLIDLKSQGATFGALSNQELEAIRSSITALKPGVSDEYWNAEIDNFINQMKRGLPSDMKQVPTQTGGRVVNTSGGRIKP